MFHLYYRCVEEWMNMVVIGFVGKKGCGYVIIGLVLYADYTFSQVTVITMKWSTSE